MVMHTLWQSFQIIYCEVYHLSPPFTVAQKNKHRLDTTITREQPLSTIDRTSFPWNLRHPLQKAQLRNRVQADETTWERLYQICAIIVFPAYVVSLDRSFKVALGDVQDLIPAAQSTSYCNIHGFHLLHLNSGNVNKHWFIQECHYL